LKHDIPVGFQIQTSLDFSFAIADKFIATAKCLSDGIAQWFNGVLQGQRR